MATSGSASVFAMQAQLYAATTRGFATSDAVAEMPKSGSVKVPALSKDGDLDWDGMVGPHTLDRPLCHRPLPPTGPYLVQPIDIASATL